MRYGLGLLSVAGFALLACVVGHAQDDARGDLAMSWHIPRTASAERNPVSATPDVLANGKALYSMHCQRCHGSEGHGDGPDGDPKEATADLTDGSRGSINPDGVVFYKIWNGRFRPEMPAFGMGMSIGRESARGTLSRDEAWTIVAYVQTLRKLR